MHKNGTIKEIGHSNYNSEQETLQDTSHRQFLISEVLRHVNAAADEAKKPIQVSEAINLAGNSNKVAHLTLNDGRRLILKCSGFNWAAPRFQNARRATSLLRRNGSVIAPQHIFLSEETTAKPVMAYWYIPLPVLKDLWNNLSTPQQIDAVRSLGRMLRSVHNVEVDRYGSLINGEDSSDSFLGYMENDLQQRLKPAVWGRWPEAITLTDRLTELAQSIPQTENRPNLVHNDLHLGNVLCRVEGEKIQCTGLLDFEAAAGGRPESDLASAMVLHDSLFGEAYHTDNWLDDFNKYLIEGYGKTPDPDSLLFFKGYHQLNMGYFSALNGNNEHAGRAADSIRNLLREL